MKKKKRITKMRHGESERKQKEKTNRCSKREVLRKREKTIQGENYSNYYMTQRGRDKIYGFRKGDKTGTKIKSKLLINVIGLASL